MTEHDYPARPAGEAACTLPGAPDTAVWTSSDLLDHMEARPWCVGCPVAAECADMARAMPFTEGTWAGVLWSNGHRLRGLATVAAITDTGTGAGSGGGGSDERAG